MRGWAVLGVGLCGLAAAAYGWSEVGLADDPAMPVAIADAPPVEPATDRYGSRSSVATTAGAAWEFAEGLSIRIDAATRLGSGLSARGRGDAGLVLVRVDFSYTNNARVANVSEGRQLPVRLLYGSAREEADADPGFVGTSDQLTLRVPTRVEPGATVRGAVSFAVPTAATDVLALLVVEPRSYTEHLFTEVEDLLGRA